MNSPKTLIAVHFKKNIFLKIYCIVLIFTFTPNQNQSQLINYELIATFSEDSLNSIWKEYSIPKLMVPINNGIEIYHVNYYTNWIDGTKIKASGRYLVPQNRTNSPTLVYNHGTRIKKGRPKITGGENILCMIFATDGYAVLSPDYIGLGEGEKTHLYCNVESEALAGIDFLLAIKELNEKINVKVNDQLFITGYSQGGHAAMSMHKVIERDYKKRIKITASSPMSGPYNVSGVQGELMFNKYSQPHYLPYLLYGLNTAYQIWPENEFYNIYRKPYDTLIPKLFNGNYKIKSINKALPEIPINIIKPELINTYKKDSNFIIRKLLQRNDVSNWKPLAPIQMCYCEADEEVLYENAILTKKNMMALGAKNITARSAGKKYGHGKCAGFSTLYTKYYFDTFKKRKTTTGKKGAFFKRCSLSLYKIFDN